MPGMGPPPGANPRRRNAVPGTIYLPAEGRRGRTPKWPIGEPTERETDLWRDLWKKPQAVAWERFGFGRLVARYVRVTLAAELVGLGSAPILGEARQLEDRLGLSPMAMLRLRWEIVTDELTERRETTSSTTRKRPRIVDPKLVAVDA